MTLTDQHLAAIERRLAQLERSGSDTDKLNRVYDLLLNVSFRLDQVLADRLSEERIEQLTQDLKTATAALGGAVKNATL